MSEKINLSFEIISGKSMEAHHDLTNICISESTPIYDFGSSLNYLCIISDKRDEVKALSYMLSEHLNDIYLFIYIHTENSSAFSIGISNKWLRSNLSFGFDLQDKYMVAVIHNVVINLSANHGVISSRHLLFQKQFEFSSFKPLFLQSYCFQFLYTLLVNINSTLNPKEVTSFKSFELKKIIDIEQKVVGNLLKSSPTVKEMANMAGMSISKFKLLFHEAFDDSPHQYFLDKKLILAKEMLQTGQYSISQVSYKIGFNHPSGFTRLFKNKFQSPPSAMYSSISK